MAELTYAKIVQKVQEAEQIMSEIEKMIIFKGCDRMFADGIDMQHNDYERDVCRKWQNQCAKFAICKRDFDNIPCVELVARLKLIKKNMQQIIDEDNLKNQIVNL